MTTIALFGASGSTGTQVLAAAARHKVRVHAFVRRPGSVMPSRDTEEVVGELGDTAAIAAAIDGCDAVAIVFGPRAPYTDIFCAEGTAAILREMDRVGINRVVCQTGAMIGDYPQNRTLPFQLLARWYQRTQPGPHTDRVRQEERVQRFGAGWTIVKPPRLTDGAGKRGLAVGPEVRVGLLSSVSRVDMGELVLEECVSPSLKQRVAFVRR